eukprot:11186099-Lingulodinium_polyedra.AAC.1
MGAAIVPPVAATWSPVVLPPPRQIRRRIGRHGVGTRAFIVSPVDSGVPRPGMRTKRVASSATPRGHQAIVSLRHLAAIVVDR